MSAAVREVRDFLAATPDAEDFDTARGFLEQWLDRHAAGDALGLSAGAARRRPCGAWNSTTGYACNRPLAHDGPHAVIATEWASDE